MEKNMENKHEEILKSKEKDEGEIIDEKTPPQEDLEDHNETNITEVKSRQIEEPIFKEIEDKRSFFLGEYRKFRLVNTIIMFVAMAVLVGAFIGFSFLQPYGIWIAIGITVLALVGVFIYTRFSKKRIEEKVQDYTIYLFKAYNDYLFDDPNYKDLHINSDSTITLEEFQSALIYKDITSVNGRNLLSATFKDHALRSSDMVAYINQKDEKGRIKTVPMFVGKYIALQCDVEVEDVVLIYVKGHSNLVTLPSMASELNLLVDEKTFQIYGKEDDKKKIITNQILQSLRKIKVDDVVLDISISIQKGLITVMMNIDDAFMILPFQNAFDSAPIKAVHKAILSMNNVLSKLCEKK